MILAAVPIKPFGVAKARLGPVLDSEQRSTVGRAVAARTVALVAGAGADTAVVTADPGVAAWARANGTDVILEDEEGPSGLDGAAAAVARRAVRRGVPWAMIHADLPLSTREEFELVLTAAATGPVLAPSYDGGTNVIGSTPEGFSFSFGEGSFQRHLARLPGARVITSPGLALDLDTPRDLAQARRSARGRWLESLLDTRR